MATLKKYTAKPNQVDAVQVTAENIQDLVQYFRGGIEVQGTAGGLVAQYLQVPTVRGVMLAAMGDYVVQHSNNQVEVMNSAQFESIYQNA